MKIEDGQIVEATEGELYSYWLQHWSYLISFDHYIQRLKMSGVIIHDNQ